jgi:hypothetical protein
MPPDGFHHFIECHLTKDVFYCSVCQHWISLMGGKKDLDSAFLKINVVIVIID